jgi:hypothetical protein
MRLNQKGRQTMARWRHWRVRGEARPTCGRTFKSVKRWRTREASNAKVEETVRLKEAEVRQTVDALSVEGVANISALSIQIRRLWPRSRTT